MYQINLTDEEQKQLLKITKTGKTTAKEILHANILLSTADNRPTKLTVKETAQKNNTSTVTVQKIRQTYATQGINAALKRKQRQNPPTPPKITGEIQAHIVALACSQPPNGHAKWTLRLLADKAVELEHIDQISHVSIRTVLKKHNINLI